MDNSATSVDLTQKYQKLASEYSKLRTQTTVLKKAIADEQSKNVDMKDLLKEKEQLTRKLEQEIECLNFRNMQLMKRVGILQEDLLVFDDKSKKNKTKSQSSPLPNETKSILDAELQSRIEENEKLHQLVYITEIEQKRIVEDVSTKLLSVQEELSQQQALWNEKLSSQEITISKLTDERAKIEIKLKNLEKELLDCQMQENVCKEELDKVHSELSGKLQTTLHTLEQNLPFVDSDNGSLQLNTPVFVHQYWKDITKYFAVLGIHLAELLRKLSDLHMYMEQHIQLFIVESILSQNESDILRKFVQILHEHTTYLKPIEVSYSLFQSSIASDSTFLWSDGFKSSPFICDISKYVSYLQKLLPYILLSLQMKLKSLENIPKLAEIIKVLQELSVQIVQGFTKLERWLILLSNYNTLNQKTKVKTSPNFIIHKITESVNYLAKYSDEIRKQFSCKIAAEHQLSTVSNNVKTTDQCVLSCLVSLTKILQKLLKVSQENHEIFDTKKLFGSLRQNPSVHGAVIGFRKRASRYIQTLQQETPAEVPYCLAIKNLESVQGYTENQEVLRQQFAALEKKVTKLEQEKEHWMLECQLLQAKQRREMKFEGNSEPLPSNDSSVRDMEECVKEHIHSLVCKLQLADTKSVAFQTECNALYQRLQISEHQCEEYKKELLDTKCNFEILKDELQATIKNYEVQLGTMTEHLANMNDKLTLQKEEIDTLRHANVKKSRSK